MKSRILPVLSFLFLLPVWGFTQSNDPVLLTVGGDEVKKSEFLNIYLKNNPEGENIDQMELQEYLELFIRFKLKVKEAESLGMDTVAAFRTELAGYRADLAKPYLTDKATIDRLVRQAYERMQFDIRASHILIMVEKDASPADTMEAWNQAMEIRKEFLGGADFGMLAEKYSQDPSAKDSKSRNGQTTIPGNRGDLGYFTALDMLYPFENGAYATEVGKVSKPIRTDYGYHLILVSDRKPAMGKAIMAHIHVTLPPSPSVQDSARAYLRINQIHQEILNGMSFEQAASKYSDDKSSAARGGLLPEFGVNRMVPEIIELLALMDSGQVAPPIRTNYGWHIIKLINTIPPGSFEILESEIRSKVTRDSRSTIGREHAALKVQKENKFREYRKNLEAMRELIDSTILISAWSIPEGAELDGKLLRIGKTFYYQRDLAHFIIDQQKRYQVTNVDGFLDYIYARFRTETCISYLDGQLEGKYPEFRMLVKEYRDGILLFNLMDERVWSKAVKDTSGLRAYFEENNADYMWKDRIDAVIYTCADEGVATQLRDLMEQGYTGTQLTDTLNRIKSLNLRMESGKYEKGDNPKADLVPWEKGLSENVVHNGQVIIVEIREVLEPSMKSFKAARGLATAAYQEKLEADCIAELNAKYPVEVNQDVLDTIK